MADSSCSKATRGPAWVLVLVLAAACAPARAPSPATPDEVYARTVRVARRGELPISSALTPLLSCSGGPEATARVATWAGSHIGIEDGALKAETWVTVVPELHERCSRWGSGEQLDARFREVLGLPPRWEAVAVTSFTVRCADVFRPCRDPETTDRSCDRAFRPDVSAEHRAWFEHQTHAAFDLTPAFPWTGLGYTYDWGHDAGHGEGSFVGLSEYVVRRGAHVTSVIEEPTAVHCRPR